MSNAELLDSLDLLKDGKLTRAAVILYSSDAAKMDVWHLCKNRKIWKSFDNAESKCLGQSILRRLMQEHD